MKLLTPLNFLDNMFFWDSLVPPTFRMPNFSRKPWELRMSGYPRISRITCFSRNSSVPPKFSNVLFFPESIEVPNVRIPVNFPAHILKMIRGKDRG